MYDDFDKSVSLGAPIECYEFIAQHRTWRYTSNHDQVIVAGQLYLPFQITRTAIEITSIIDSPATMDFNIPADSDLARDFCYTKSPRELVVIVRRVHKGSDYSTDYKREWTGRLSGTRFGGDWATIRTASILRTELNGFLSSVYYQKSCNHVLYDERCKASRAAHTATTSVTKVQNQIITVDNMFYAANALANGTITNTRTGEKQGIISNISQRIRIGFPFFDILPGDTVELTLGCDHQRLGHCKNRFNNTANYGGFDFIPEVNPFEKLIFTTATRTELSEKGAIIPQPPPSTSGTSKRVTSGTRRTNTGTTQFGFNSKPQPRPSSTRNTNFTTDQGEGAGNIPSAFLGQPVSAVLGRKRVANNNLIWTGNLRPITETVITTTITEEEVDVGGGYKEKVTKTETTYTTTTTGYYIDMHLGICLGPDVHLKAIYVNNSPIWTGDIGPARTEITLPDDDSFLSKCKLVFQGGQFNQAPEPGISVADYPGYVGIATAFIKDVRADLAMGNISFEVVRVPNPLSLDTATNRSVDDLNVASALVEVMTNEWGWGGLDISNIDVVTFTSIASTIKSESNFCSIKIDNEVGITDVIGELQNQGGLVIFENPETGLITGRTVRYDFNYSSMARFNPDNIIEFRSGEKTGWPDTIEQARGIYTERDAEYNDVPVFVQNVANISQSGRAKRTVVFEYKFVPNKSLALALLSRDVATLSAPNYSFTLLTNRDGASRVPGEIISVTWPKARLLNTPMQVISVRKQDIYSNNVVLAVKQAKFPDNRALFGEGGTPFDPDFNVDPLTPLGAKIVSAPYYMARAARGISTSDANPLNFPLFLPKPANSFQSFYDAYIDNLPNTTSPVVAANGVTYPTYGALTAPISRFDGFATGVITSISIDGVINPVNLVDATLNGVKSGRLFAFIGDEIMSFESVTDNGGGNWTLNNVHRGLLDTVAQDHADNTDMYIIGNNFSAVSKNGFPYPVGYTPDWLIVSNGVTKLGLLADALVTSAWAPTNMRTLSPPRPHNTRVNGATRSSSPVSVVEGASTTVTWSTRSRVSNTVKLQTDAADTAENSGAAVQKHRVYHRSAGGTITDIGGSAFLGNSATFVMPNVDNGAGTIYVEAELILGGVLYTSLAQDRIPVTVS